MNDIILHFKAQHADKSVGVFRQSLSAFVADFMLAFGTD